MQYSIKNLRAYLSSITFCILLSTTLFILVSVWSYLPWWELALRSDASPLSWLSSALLFGCAILAIQLKVNKALPSILNICLAVSLLGMALDEQFMYHEYWKYHCQYWIKWCETGNDGHFNWILHFPMLMVGIVGTIVLMGVYRSVNDQLVRRLIMAALGVGIIFALGTHFGHATGLLPVAFGRFEEVFEIFSEALFMCALLEIRPVT